MAHLRNECRRGPLVVLQELQIANAIEGRIDWALEPTHVHRNAHAAGRRDVLRVSEGRKGAFEEKKEQIEEIIQRIIQRRNKKWPRPVDVLYIPFDLEGTGLPGGSHGKKVVPFGSHLMLQSVKAPDLALAG